MRVFDCEVSGGVATITNADGLKIEVTDVILICDGVSKSNGKLVISSDGAVYIANTQPDLSETMDKIISLCEKLSTLCSTSIGAGSATIDQPFITLKPEFESIKSELEAKKDNLI